ncbi:hypothetical protein GCM10010106_47830 [Thermopolyspora flexuosa]|nr:hypothetical protein GCM10010106_47830 [Thermopolyspora flexuosa]
MAGALRARRVTAGPCGGRSGPRVPEGAVPAAPPGRLFAPFRAGRGGRSRRVAAAGPIAGLGSGSAFPQVKAMIEKRAAIGLVIRSAYGTVTDVARKPAANGGGQSDRQGPVV